MILKWKQKFKKLNIFLYVHIYIVLPIVAMKRVRSSGNGLDSMHFNKEKKNKLDMETVKVYLN